jgi:hypothetical protein
MDLKPAGNSSGGGPDDLHKSEGVECGRGFARTARKKRAVRSRRVTVCDLRTPAVYSRPNRELLSGLTLRALNELSAATLKRRPTMPPIVGRVAHGLAVPLGGRAPSASVTLP